MGSVGQSDNAGVMPKSRYIYHLYVLALFMLLMLNLSDLHVMLYSAFSQNFCDCLNNIEWAKITATAVFVHMVTNFLAEILMICVRMLYVFDCVSDSKSTDHVHSSHVATLQKDYSV